MLPYSVKVKYSKGPEQTIAQFKQRDDALTYIKAKLQNDVLMRVETIYQLWELGELEKTFDQNSEEASGTSGGSAGGGKSSGQNFRPSPLQTTARPPGMPNNWKDSDDDKKN